MGALALESLIGGVAVFVPLLLVVLVADKVLGRDSMGGGDLKLFFVAGLYFGWQQCLFLIIVACVIGIVLAFAAPAPHTSADGTEDNANQPRTRRTIPSTVHCAGLLDYHAVRQRPDFVVSGTFLASPAYFGLQPAHLLKKAVQ